MRRMYRSLRRAFRASSLFGLVLYVVLPLIYVLSSSLQRHLIFKHNAFLPYTLNFSAPERENLFGAYNRYIPSSSGGIIALWQILPAELVLKEKNYLQSTFSREHWFIEQLMDDRPVVLYCHGNTPSRGVPHRILLYKLLQELDYHIIAFDYRGFADSSYVEPSEESVTMDVIDVISWIRVYSSAPLYVWGHSLGTGISLSAAAILCERSSTCIDALVLQSPFSSIADEIHSHPLSYLYSKWPFFDWLFIRPLTNQGIVFNSKVNILHVTCPILILHAEDDIVVPFHLGKKLFEIARANGGDRKPPRAKFVPFAAEYGYGHNFIVMAPELSVIIKKFLDEAFNLISTL